MKEADFEILSDLACALLLLHYILFLFCFREAGVVVRNVEIATGDVSINLNEELLLKRKGEDAFSSTDVAMKAVKESGTAEKPVKPPANLAIMKYASMFPEKVSCCSTLTLCSKLDNIFFLFIATL